jgi:3-oxoadipate enol-lactonase
MQDRVLERQASIHYWLHGKPTNPLVVMTHGAGADHQMFDAQLPALAQDYFVLTWDVRGHGCSRPMGSFSLSTVLEDLLEILDEIGASEAIFVGQSMGGNQAQELVRHHPERVRALVLIDCARNTASLGWLEHLPYKLPQPCWHGIHTKH